MNIKRRGMECDTRCVCCQRLGEDGAHLFLKCKEVRSLWIDLNLEKERLILRDYPYAKSVVHEILRMEREKAVMIACLLWRWWTRRNKINAREIGGSKESVRSQVYFWVGEATRYCQKQKQQQVTRTVLGEKKWQAPVGDTLKINVDGAFYPKKKSGGWGFVVRNCDSRIRGSGASVLNLINFAAQAEIIAC
jgi:hypothetical protein